jgi:hypothetical protein
MKFNTDKPINPTAYIFDIDRFMFFTESEKCSLFEGLKDQYNAWKCIDKGSGGMTDMLKRMLDELDEVI